MTFSPQKAFNRLENDLLVRAEEDVYRIAERAETELIHPLCDEHDLSFCTDNASWSFRYRSGPLAGQEVEPHARRRGALGKLATTLTEDAEKAVRRVSASLDAQLPSLGHRLVEYLSPYNHQEGE